MWTIMVAAKVDHSRVFVTKFHQNWSTLKGRSAGERRTHTDRQTNSAENNGPSGLQSGQQFIIAENFWRQNAFLVASRQHQSSGDGTQKQRSYMESCWNQMTNETALTASSSSISRLIVRLT